MRSTRVRMEFINSNPNSNFRSFIRRLVVRSVESNKE
jgi:hypothetical protein